MLHFLEYDILEAVLDGIIMEASFAIMRAYYPQQAGSHCHLRSLCNWTMLIVEWFQCMISSGFYCCCFKKVKTSCAGGVRSSEGDISLMTPLRN